MLSVLTLIIGLLTFLRGFFPQKTVIPGFNDQVAPVDPKFSKLVFMVVDAMRSDLMFGVDAQMPNVHQLIQSGHALPFTGYSNPPTVTLPRLKGITTGGAPSFLDAVLNIAEGSSASPLGDSWIHQLKRHNKTLHMYGDDTWLKLFPQMFDKVDGTSSFYVNDYTEVDLNVTRHVKPSLEAQDWDVLILHYLGLDHIGHKGGPNSPLMGPKQLEMDSIIKQIFDGLDDDTLFIVTGDHGMNEVGNHGGSSEGETSAALLFLAKNELSGEGNPAPITSPNYEYYLKVPQIDLVPTISMLLGLPVPQNSLGLPIPVLVDSQQYMCDHFSKLLQQDFECTHHNLLQLQDEFMRASTEYNQPLMVAGILVMAVGVVLSLFGVLRQPIEAKAPWLAFSALYCVAMFGSSTIEEEHQFWYWGVGGIVLACLAVRVGSMWRWAVFLVAFRLIRGWHNAGQKWIGPESYSISSYLFEHPGMLWPLVAATYVTLMLRFENDYIGLIALLFSVVFKVNGAMLAEYPLPFDFEFSPVPAPLIFQAMLGCLGLRTLLRKYKFNPTLDLVLVTQSRLVDIPLFLLYWIITAVLPATVFKGHEWDGSLLNIALQYASFFATGGSNSLATVDLSNAYNGISSYNIPAVSLLTFVSNWVGPIYWTINGPRSGDWKPLYRLFYSVGGFSIIFACYLLQDHLFVWTVFSPKLLYYGAWLVFMVLENLCMP